MRLKFIKSTFGRAALAVALLGAFTTAQAGLVTGTFDCISANEEPGCALAEAQLGWSWDDSLSHFTIANAGGGYVSEVYFDLLADMQASFVSGVGTVMFSAENTSPAALPGGNAISFTSDAAFDSGPKGKGQYGIDAGESATFLVTSSLGAVDSASFTSGIRVQSVIDGQTMSMVSVSEPVPVVSVSTPVPEPAGFAMALLGLAIVGGLARARGKA